MNVMKRARTVLLGLLCAAALLLPAWATEARAAMPDNGDLFYGYLLQRAGALDEAALMADARSQLGTKDRESYDQLKALAAEVAAGTRTNTVLALSSKNFQKYWTAAQLDVASIIVGSDISSEAVDALYKKMMSAFFDDPDPQNSTSPVRVIHAVQFDSPYEFYWFDGTNGYNFGLPSYTIRVAQRNGEYCLYPDVAGFESSETVDLTYEFTLPVSSDYGSGNTLNPDLRAGVDAALSKAQSIVAAHAGESDYDKLLSYATEICNLTEYNHAAANDANAVPYGNPWQMLHVFDGDPSTTVVCEGYSKAFKYLCDLSAFQSPNVSCLLVSGTLGGAHMWNLVTMENNKSYLVDVTNSDGASGGVKYLFLKGGTKDSAGQYTFYGNFVYQYDSTTISTFGETLLTLDTADYQLPPPVQIRGCSLTLVDDIALNFYLSVDSAVTSDSGAYVKLTNAGASDQQMISGAFTGTMDGVEGTVRRFTVHLPPKRMNDNITLECFNGSDAAYTMRDPKGNNVTSYQYCIQDYLTLAKNQSNEKLADLAAFMSAYGYYAQMLFGYDASNAVSPAPATASAIAAVTADTLSACAAVDTGSVTGLTPAGDNLTLEDTITQRYIFSVSGDVSSYTFTIDGNSATAKPYGSGQYCLEVPGVVAKRMDLVHTLTIAKGGETFTHKCSTLSYAYKALTDSSASENLRNLAKAMYCYHTAAKAYFYAA